MRSAAGCRYRISGCRCGRCLERFIRLDELANDGVMLLTGLPRCMSCLDQLQVTSEPDEPGCCAVGHQADTWIAAAIAEVGLIGFFGAGGARA